MKNVVLYNNWARGAVTVITGILMFSGLPAYAYGTSEPAQPSTAVQIPDISLPSLKNISIPTSISTIPKMVAAATGDTSSSSFNFFQFFNLSGFGGSGTQGGIYGFVVLIINIFISVLSVMGQILKFILGLVTGK